MNNYMGITCSEETQNVRTRSHQAACVDASFFSLIEVII